MAPLTQSDLRRLFELLNEELRQSDTEAELFVVGGAVMYLAYAGRPSTQDVVAVFRPAAAGREAAARVGARAGLSPEWLNDSVKEFVSAHGDYAQFMELDHLRVMLARPAYLLAMKCLAFRIGTPSFTTNTMSGICCATSTSAATPMRSRSSRNIIAGAVPAEDAVRAGGAAAKTCAITVRRSLPRRAMMAGGLQLQSFPLIHRFECSDVPP